jgi:hypothetical protein
MFFLQQNWRTRRWNKFFPEVGGEGRDVAQIMYKLVSKCKNDKQNKENSPLSYCIAVIVVPTLIENHHPL